MRTQNLKLNKPLSEQNGFLNAVSSRGLRQEIEIGDYMSIGRDTNNGLVLSDPYVSLRHGRITKFSHSFVIKDLESLNGVYVNGTRVREAILNDQDRIQFGKSDFIFSYERDQKRQILLESSLEKAWDDELQRLPSIAKSEFSVLITGPTGSGKEHIARMIHKKSSRSFGPFFSLNCASFQESLIESELFGHEKGSFTGALYKRKGAFESARGGSLFLDEIGDLPLAMQAKLLRVLENSEFKPLGSDQFCQSDVRIIAATHHDLEEKMNSGNFRRDLFYRLNVLSVKVPHLNERMKDFENILYFFAKEMRVRFSIKAIDALKSYHWPGNIRELKNFVSKCSAYFSPSLVTESKVYKILRSKMAFALGKSLNVKKSSNHTSMIQTVEKALIEKLLHQNNGRQSKTAEMLNMPKSTLNDKVKVYKIKIENFKNKD